MKKECDVKIGSNVECKAVGFSLTITGTVKYIYNNTAAVFVEKVQPADQSLASEKHYMALALIKDIHTI
ncbi:hypothetical protein D920_02696 [Enterococcus faecalis 13-SD-W-01]|nr:hypothetical protein D920_02696 [Enterococcus faecalis 13-SD-W-01]